MRMGEWHRTDWLLAPLVCLAASGLLAVAYVVSQGGFGAGDLTPALIWTVPLALMLAALARALRPLWRRLHPLLSWLLSSMLGLVLGFAWTLAVALLLGPWFGAFSIPVLFCWTGGGLSGLVAASAVHAPRRRTHVALLLLPLFLLVAAGQPSVAAWMTGSEQTQLVFLRHIPGPEPLSILDELGGLTDHDRQLLHESGLTGQVRLEGSYAGGRGRVNRALVVMSRQVDAALDLPQPDGDTVLYLQSSLDFQLYPPDARTQPRPMRVAPASHDADQTLFELYQKDGSVTRTTGFTWPRP